jgi:hypothetical protein
VNRRDDVLWPIQWIYVTVPTNEAGDETGVVAFLPRCYVSRGWKSSIRFVAATPAGAPQLSNAPLGEGLPHVVVSTPLLLVAQTTAEKHDEKVGIVKNRKQQQQP